MNERTDENSNEHRTKNKQTQDTKKEPIGKRVYVLLLSPFVIWFCGQIPAE